VHRLVPADVNLVHYMKYKPHYSAAGDGETKMDKRFVLEALLAPRWLVHMDVGTKPSEMTTSQQSVLFKKHERTCWPVIVTTTAQNEKPNPNHW